MSSKLPRSFYRRDDVVQISQELIGKVLCTRFNNQLTAGIIVETEAYNGRTDKACHAYPDVRTKRTETIYGPPGHAYIYLCYGIHHLFNIVTNREGLADAILIRAIEPLEGQQLMIMRRNQKRVEPMLTNGPGKLSQALGISTVQNKTDLRGDTIWIEDRGVAISAQNIAASPRVGIDYAGEDAKLPWRFTLKESKWVSK